MFADPGQVEAKEETDGPRSCSRKRAQNGVSLLNYREFFIMVVGSFGPHPCDGHCLGHLAWHPHSGILQKSEIVVGLPFADSLSTQYATPPLISGNKFGQDWKGQKFYTANNMSKGGNVAVGDFNGSEYNDADSDCDDFAYDPSKNPWDRGPVLNNTNFWCHPRWHADTRVEF